MSDTLELFDAVEAGPVEPNPCRRLYGPGPEGKTCATCTLLASLRDVEGKGPLYAKCTLRRVTHGAGSDHRKRWQACGRYTEAAPVCCICGAAPHTRTVRYSARDGKPYCSPCHRLNQAQQVTS